MKKRSFLIRSNKNINKKDGTLVPWLEDIGVSRSAIETLLEEELQGHLEILLEEELCRTQRCT